MRSSQIVLQQIEMANFHFKLVLKPNPKIAIVNYFFSVLIWLKIQVQTNKEGAATMHDYSVNARVTFKTDTSS